MTLPPVGTAHRKATDPGDPDYIARCVECGRRTDDLDDDWLCEDCRPNEEGEE